MQIIPSTLLLLGILVTGRAGSGMAAVSAMHGSAGDAREGAKSLIPSFMFGALARTGSDKHRSRVEDTVSHSFNAVAGGKLTLASAIGDVEVVTSDTNVVTVEILRRVDADDKQEAARLLSNLLVETAQQNGNVTVRVRFRRETPDDERRRIRLRFQVSIPRTYNLDVSTVGFFKAGDLQGNVSAETSGGDISLGRIQGEVIAATSGGHVRIEATSGPVKLTTAGGPVSIENAASAIEAETGGGSFKAHLSRQPQSNSTIQTSGGKISLSIEQGVGVELDALATNGHIVSEYDETAKPKSRRDSLRTAVNGGGPVLVLRSEGGSIYLGKRSPEGE
jgi:hypothetical protein